MLSLFYYNWQVREDWLNWCQTISKEEFHKERIGGMKSIRETFIHIIDCELLWLNSIVENKIIFENRNTINNLHDIKAYAAFVKSHTECFLQQFPSGYANKIIEVKRRDGTLLHFTQKRSYLI